MSDIEYRVECCYCMWFVIEDTRAIAACVCEADANLICAALNAGAR